MVNPKGYIIEYKKNGKVALVIVIAASPKQALEIARREKDTDLVSVIDESEVIFAD